MAPTPGRSWTTGDARRLQRVGGADARKLQQPRRAHGAAAEDHFAIGAQRLDAAAAGDLDADRAAVLDDDLQRLRVEADGEIACGRATGFRKALDVEERSALRVES